MTGWLIAGGILLLLALCFFTPAKLQVTLQDDAKPVLRLSFLGIPLWRSNQKKSHSTASSKMKKNKKKRKKKKKSAKTNSEKASLSERLEQITDALSGIRKGLRRLLKGIHFQKICIAIGVGNPDAADCALAYGKLQAALYPCLSILGTLCSVSYEAIDVRCCFGANRTRYFISFTVRLSIACVCSALLAFGISFLWNTVQRNAAEPKKSDVHTT